jgi:hypothetical protein
MLHRVKTEIWIKHFLLYQHSNKEKKKHVFEKLSEYKLLCTNLRHHIK